MQTKARMAMSVVCHLNQFKDGLVDWDIGFRLPAVC